MDNDIGSKLGRSLNWLQTGPLIYFQALRGSGNLEKNIYNLPWFVYILECQDKTLYVGVTLDVAKRLKEHNTTSICKYTRIRKPLKLVYQEKCLNHHAARGRELGLKEFNREEKLDLIEKSHSVG